MSNLGFRKSKTFLSNRSSSMQKPTLPHQTLGEEIVHFSHPQHPLAQLSTPYLFTCSGCKEHGAGMRFKCQNCEFSLHDFCALAPPSLHHFLHSQHQLVFYTKPGGFLRSTCDVCGKTTKGFAFRCTTCNFSIHPCCSMLQQVMDFPTHSHTMSLPLTTKILTGDSSFICGECRRKRSGQFYHCDICDYHLHAVCAKDMVNGLYVHGISAPEKPNMLGTAARLASHAVLEFIGGIIEGIGEGVGEALIDNIGRGKGTREGGK